MKKIFITTCFISMLCFAYGQVMQKKIENNNAVAAYRAPVKTAKPPVFLNVHSPAYRVSVGARNPNTTIKLFVFTKTLNYPDNTRLTLKLLKSPAFAGQPESVSPTVHSNNASSDNGMDCTTSVVSLSATSTDFMNSNYSSQTTHIYPGAIYTYDHQYDGSFKEENTNRNPVLIGSDNPNMTGSTYEEVANPDMFTITNAVAKLYQRFSGPSANESTSYQVSETSNAADFALKIGAGASGYGISASNVFTSQSGQQHYYLTIDARKTLFSISSSVPDSGYFKTPVNGSSPYVVIGNVSYGVRVLANLDFTFSTQQEEDNLKAAYSGYGVSANVDLDMLSKNTSLSTKINAYIIGGPSSGTSVAFDKSQLKSQLQNVLSNAAYANARAVSYQLYDMEGNVIGAMTATDQFSVRNCIPSNASKVLQAPLANIATGATPGDNKDKDTHYSFGLFDQNNRSIAAFHDDSNTDEYAESSSHSVKMNMVTAASIDDFKNGGHVHINVAPNGNDTWKINTFTLNVSFDNDLHSPHAIQWNNISLSQNARDLDLYFDNGFHAR